MKELISEIKREVGGLVSSKKDLRRFGLVVGGVFILLSLWQWWLGLLGAILILGGVILPLTLKWPYKIWLGIGLILGFVVSHLILTILFYLVITPIAVVKRLVSKKKIDDPASYWQAHPDTDWRKAMEEMS